MLCRAAVLALLVLTGCGDAERDSRPAGPVSGEVVRDAAGRIEHLVAGGHLVAWTERTPADPLDETAERRPVRLPRSTTPGGSWAA